MASTEPQMPPGWAAQWDLTHQRFLYIETATGRTQWEHPAQMPTAPIDAVAQADPNNTGSPPPAMHPSKRRQYAAGQTQAYYGGDSGFVDGGGGGAAYGGAVPHAGQPQVPPVGSAPHLFTPGLAGEAQPVNQQLQPQQAPSYFAPAGAQYPRPGEKNGQQPAYGAPPGYGQPQVNALADQFGQMGVAPKPYALYTTNLLTTPPDPNDLKLPPPEIRLPPSSCISHSPYANAHYSYQRCTMNAIPTTNTLLSKSKIPFALILTPYRSLDSAPANPTLTEGEDGSTVPPSELIHSAVAVVSDQVIARCRRCRTYINPYVQFIDGGNRWRCCMCGMSNELPQMFDWDQARNQPGDRWARPELNHAVVEFVAPTEYMVRPPQPPVYLFLIDVSHAAIQSGMVATATRTILESLDRLPNEDDRTKVGIIAFDVALYFFSLPAATAPTPDSDAAPPAPPESSMLVVSDLDDVFLPKPNDLLVNLTESRAAFEGLLARLPEMFAESHSVGSAMGPALQAGFKLISAIGGKMITLSASMPTLGAGALKNREDPKLLGTNKESSLLQPASNFYKTFAIDCSRAQVSVDMFLFSSSYTDVASLSCLPHYTSGQTYFYPAFNASRSEDALKFAHEFGHVLQSPAPLEAVIRVRASRGLRMSAFHGNFFVRSTDLLALPAVPYDQSYAIEVQIEDNITTPFVVFQTAVLHTTCYGERRIRVITHALPTTSSVAEIYAGVDQIAVATFLANKAVERSLSSKLEDARDALMNKIVEILTAYRGTMTGGGGGGQLAVSENMKMLPILVFGLLKHVGIRHSAQIPSDLRAYAQVLLTSLPSQTLIPYIHPNFYSLHNMPPEAGTISEKGVLMPPVLPLSSERLERHGLYLIEDGQTLFLWVGRDAVPQLVVDVFDLPSYEQLRGGKTTLPLLDNPFSRRVNAVIAKTREMRRGSYYPHLYVVKEDGEPPLRLWALSALIQDRQESLPSYQQWLGQVRDKVNGTSYT